MITEIQIENYKSIHTLKMKLGRVNVFIGENGCGKSNILEAIALAAAAASNKLDNEFLAPRGIRVVEPQFMRSAFDQENIKKEIKISFKGEKESEFSCELHHDNQPYSEWANRLENAMFDIGTDENAIFEVFGSLRTNGDFIKLKQAFGIREYSGGFLPGFVSPDLGLDGWIQQELDGSEINELNAILQRKGITYRF
jgi:predicted ATP-dependent endonuclease of OLD family